MAEANKDVVSRRTDRRETNEDVTSISFPVVLEEVEHADDEDDSVKHEQWRKEQDLLKARLVEIDSPEVLSWRSEKGKFDLLRFVAGVDISFDKNDPTKACAAMTVLSFPSLEVRRL
jgi:hypothetical protein